MVLPHRTPVCKALQTLEAHLPQIRTVDDWAQLCGYTRAAFARAIYAYHDRTPGEILRDHRLRKIRHLLATEDVKLYEVALCVGLPNAGALNHFVNVWVGIPPSRWRERLRMGFT